MSIKNDTGRIFLRCLRMSSDAPKHSTAVVMRKSVTNDPVRVHVSQGDESNEDWTHRTEMLLGPAIRADLLQGRCPFFFSN